MAQVTGIIKIYLDGELQRSKPGASLSVGGMKRDGVLGHSYYGFVEEAVAAELEFTLAAMANTDCVELSNMKDITVRFETDTGQTYLCAQMTTMEPVKLQSGGDASVKMIGPPAVLE